MNEEMPWNLLARYLAGELNGLEKKRFEAWIQEDPEREREVEILRTVWEPDFKQSQSDTDSAWQRLSFSIDTDERKQQQRERILQLRQYYKNHLPGKKKNGHAFKSARGVVLVAASVLIAVFAGLFAYQLNGISDQEAFTDSEYRILITKNGEQATYRLNDGTRVIMHAGSRLEIPHDYNETERRLIVEGEAFFDVRHNPDKPFIVQSDYTFTEVIGTKFLVQSWPDGEPDIGVVVEEGKVLFGDLRTQFSEEKKEVHLTKNQHGTINRQGEVEIREYEDLSWYTGWIEERLVFENRSLTEILPRLERWYDIEISVSEKSMLDEKVTAEIDYSLPMTDVLNGLAMVLRVDMEREGRSFLLKFK